MFKKIKNYFQSICCSTANKYFNLKCQRRIKTNNFSIICPNCIGGIIYHRLGMNFLSPTINLFQYPSDFMKFILDYKKYLSYDLEFVSSNRNYPVAKLNDIFLYFNHYKTEKEAKDAWYRRLARINWNNIVIIMYERENTTREQLISLRNVPCKKLIVLTEHTENLDIEYLKYIKRTKGNPENSQVFLDRDFFGIHTFEKQWDFVDWLNK